MAQDFDLYGCISCDLGSLRLSFPLLRESDLGGYADHSVVDVHRGDGGDRDFTALAVFELEMGQAFLHYIIYFTVTVSWR